MRRSELLNEINGHLGNVRESLENVRLEQISDDRLEVMANVLRNTVTVLESMSDVRLNPDCRKPSRINMCKRLGKIYGFIQSFDEVDAMTDGQLEVLALRCLRMKKDREADTVAKRQQYFIEKVNN